MDIFSPLIHQASYSSPNTVCACKTLGLQFLDEIILFFFRTVTPVHKPIYFDLGR